jgi:hypothetical protein
MRTRTDGLCQRDRCTLEMRERKTNIAPLPRSLFLCYNCDESDEHRICRISTCAYYEGSERSTDRGGQMEAEFDCIVERLWRGMHGTNFDRAKVDTYTVTIWRH